MTPSARWTVLSPSRRFPTMLSVSFWTMFTLIILSCGEHVKAETGCLLTVHVDGLRNHKGVVGCAVFHSPAGWPENDVEAYTRAAIPVNGESVSIRFAHVPPGRYALVVLHDENANHRLDRNLFHVPKEGFGFSRNPRVGLSAPSWRDAALELTCPATQVEIHLIYSKRISGAATIVFAEWAYFLSGLREQPAWAAVVAIVTLSP